MDSLKLLIHLNREWYVLLRSYLITLADISDAKI